MKPAATIAMFILISCSVVSPGAKSQDKKLPPPPPARPKVVDAPERVWRSLTTGREYRVRVQNERLTAEWVNIPLNERQRGAFIRTECRRTGTRWIGTSDSFLPCESVEGGKRVSNWCRLTTKFEIHLMTDARISGRAEAPRRFDCRTCKILEPVWASFEWTPRPEPPPAAAEKGGTRK